MRHLHIFTVYLTTSIILLTSFGCNTSLWEPVKDPECRPLRRLNLAVYKKQGNTNLDLSAALIDLDTLLSTGLLDSTLNDALEAPIASRINAGIDLEIRAVYQM